MIVLLLSCVLLKGPEPDASDPGTEPVGGPAVDSAEDSADTGDSDPPDEVDDCVLGVPGPEYDALFDEGTLQVVRLTIPATGIAALEGSPREYVVGTFEHAGTRLRSVGIKLKGSSTFQPFDGKPAFRVKFDEFVPDVVYADLNGLTLNNLTNDRAMGREVLAYHLWREGGLPAPHASYARVYVNDEYYGLYALVEPMDEAWLDKNFACVGGDLWEASDSADLTPDGIVNLELSSGDGDGLSLADVAATLATPTGDYYALADEVVVMDAFLDYWAWTMATGNLDGYPYALNDFFLYGDPARGGRLVFTPWGLDETWDTGWVFQWGQGTVGFDCAADRACLDRVLDRTELALLAFEGEDMVARAQAAFALTEDAMLDDARKPWTPAEVDAARLRLLTMLDTWPDRVRVGMGR